MNLLPVDGQTIAFDIVSIVALIIILINFIKFLRKGFFKALIGLFSTIASLVIAYFLCQQVGQFLYDLGLGGAFHDGVYGMVSSLPGATTEITSANAGDVLPAMYEGLGIPPLISPFITMMMEAMGIISDTPIVVAEAIADGVAHAGCTGIAFLGLSLISMIVFTILGAIFDKISKIKAIGFFNKFVGAILGIAMGIAWSAILCYGLAWLSSTGFMAEWVESQLYLADDSVWTFSKALFHLANYIASSFLGLSF